MLAGLQGDEAAYRCLLQSLGNSLRVSVRGRFARLGCGDLDVEDVVQEALLAIHLKRHTWQQGEPLAPWVAAITRNKLVDVLRRRGRRVVVDLEEHIETLADPAVDVQDGATQDVERLLAQLPERQQRIVRSVSLQGLSTREAAEALQMSEGALRVALHRSLKTLAALYRKTP